MSSSDEARALRVMVEALRAEPTPELAWDEIERKLFESIAAEEATAQARAEVQKTGSSRAFGRLPGWLGFAAAAAAMVLGVELGTQSPIPTTNTTARAPRDAATMPLTSTGNARDASALRVGDVISTEAESVTFALEGTVRWSLSPASRIVVRAMPSQGGVGLGHVVALERGSIHADVVPRDASEGLVESFAVEAGRTRVAVHGTSFTVVLEPERLVVDVEHGAVAIGPVGYVGVTTGRLLVGPSRASFSLDGGRSARLLSRDEAMAAIDSFSASEEGRPALAALAADQDGVETGPDHAAAPHATIVTPTPTAALPASPPEPAGVEPPAAPIAATPAATGPGWLTTAGVRSGLERCFAQTYGTTSPSVRLLVTTTFRLTLRQDGSIEKARFEPPLKPEFQQCAGGLVAGRFADGGREIAIPLTFGGP